MPTDHDEIRELLKADDANRKTLSDDQLVAGAMNRVRSAVAQKDTLTFALVKVWTVLAQLLAPLFARLAVTQARTTSRRDAANENSNPT